MKNDYADRFELIREEIQSAFILPYVRMEEFPNSFTRKRKMPVNDMVFSILGKKGLTTSMEIKNYFEEKNIEADISKQGYLSQRKKLNYEVFPYLNSIYLANFYQKLDASNLFCNYLVLAVDGSKAEISASKENKEVFGELNQGVVRALVSCISDVNRQFILDMQIGSVKDSESELAQENILNAKKIIGNIPMLVLFDRGYPGLKLIDWLEEQNIKYLFRLSSNDYKKERSQMQENDEMVRLEHTYARIAKMRKKYPSKAEHLKEKGYTDARIVKSLTPSGEETAFLTNLSESEFSGFEIPGLYFKRWNIEEDYHTLKNKLRFESITGEATIYVYQDFWSQILVYNMVEDVLHSANEELGTQEQEKEYRYHIHANENMAVGLFKKELIGLMLESDKEIRKERMLKLQKAIEKYILPYRKSKSKERIFKKSNKYKRNLKNSF